jgi:hypothetical protein
MMTKVFALTSIVKMNGISKYSGTSPALPQRMMVSSCKMKFFSVKKTCSSQSFADTYMLDLYFCGSLSNSTKLKFYYVFESAQTIIFVYKWPKFMFLLFSPSDVCLGRYCFLATSQLFICFHV